MNKYKMTSMNTDRNDRIEDKCNKLNKAFLSHRKAPDIKALILSHTDGKLLLINYVIISFQTTFFC